MSKQSTIVCDFCLRGSDQVGPNKLLITNKAQSVHICAECVCSSFEKVTASRLKMEAKARDIQAISDESVPPEVEKN